MPASLRPITGESAVRTIALKPAFSALLTSWVTKFLSLNSWEKKLTNKLGYNTNKLKFENLENQINTSVTEAMRIIFCY